MKIIKSSKINEFRAKTTFFNTNFCTKTAKKLDFFNINRIKLKHCIITKKHLTNISKT